MAVYIYLDESGDFGSQAEVCIAALSVPRKGANHAARRVLAALNREYPWVQRWHAAHLCRPSCLALWWHAWTETRADLDNVLTDLDLAGLGGLEPPAVLQRLTSMGDDGRELFLRYSAHLGRSSVPLLDSEMRLARFGRRAHTLAQDPAAAELVDQALRGWIPKVADLKGLEDQVRSRWNDQPVRKIREQVRRGFLSAFELLPDGSAVYASAESVPNEASHEPDRYLALLHVLLERTQVCVGPRADVEIQTRRVADRRPPHPVCALDVVHHVMPLLPPGAEAWTIQVVDGQGRIHGKPVHKDRAVFHALADRLAFRLRGRLQTRTLSALRREMGRQLSLDPGSQDRSHFAAYGLAQEYVAASDDQPRPDLAACRPWAREQATRWT